MIDDAQLQQQIQEELERQRKARDVELQSQSAPKLQTDKTADALSALSSLNSKQTSTPGIEPVISPRGNSLATKMLADLMAQNKQQKSEGMDPEQMANLAQMFSSFYGGGS